MQEAVCKRRDLLNEEVQNLTLLVKSRHATREQTLRDYAQKCPGRVTSAGVPLPPGGVAFGADKLYRAAVKSADEFTEANELLRKRRESLEQLNGELQRKMQKYHAQLIRQLETPDGLANAFRLDPLLERAHARMRAATPRPPEVSIGE